MGYETLIRRAHVMTRKNTLKSLPTDTEFRVVGLDLAKSALLSKLKMCISAWAEISSFQIKGLHF